MFIRLTNGVPKNYTLGQLSRDNPQTSFPRNIPDNVLEEFGVYRVLEVAAPEINYSTYTNTQDIKLVDGVWTQVWETVELPLAEATTNIRSQRDYLLSESDWVVSKSYELGVAVPTAWATYRQALRDITTQEGFPYNVTWPTKE